MATGTTAGGKGGSETTHKRFTIAFIGAKGVGKTSIIRQFIGNQFSDVVTSTTHPQRYSTSLVTNNRILEIHIGDFPAIDKFPADSLQEWNLQCQPKKGNNAAITSNGHSSRSSSDSSKSNSVNSRSVTPPPSFCQLRKVSAYILVFDASRPATFQYVKTIREQILNNSGVDVYKKPIVVAANKHDLVLKPKAAPPTSKSVGRHRAANGKTNSTANEWNCLVRKQWRSTYVECSAKCNWQIMHLLQQTMTAIENAANDRRTGLSGESSRLYQQMQMLHPLAQLAMPLAHLGHLAHLGNIPGAAMPPIPPPGGPPRMGPLPPPRRSSPIRSGRRRMQCPIS